MQTDRRGHFKFFKKVKMKIYGIPNCNTMTKAMDWLTENNVEFEFHDYKKIGISKIRLEEWSLAVGWEELINKKGTTWRMLNPDAQKKISNKKVAFDLMIDKPSIIKRPVIEFNDTIVVGFDEEVYKQFLA